MTTHPHSIYGYFPSKDVAITFLTLYGVSTLCHIAQATYYRTYWLYATAAFCGIIELLGWSGRLWSSISPFMKIPFQIQICCTIVAPTPLLAANFVIFGHVINRLGTQYSRLSPHLYTVIFCTCDVISLVIQGVGGGIAATANTLKGANGGANIMLGGIVFQLAVIVAFAICFIEYFIRWAKHAPIRSGSSRGEMTGKLLTMLGAVLLVTLFLFIRAIYRTIELAGGWNGRIIGTELYFNVLDGGMVTLAIFTYNFLHPGFLLATSGNERFAGKEEVSNGIDA
jgi:hypothetical protein